MLRRVEHESGLVGLRSPLLAHFGVPHLFTTRVGPGGELCVRTLDDGLLGTLRSAVGVGPRARLTSVRQVHGARAIAVGERPLESDEEADALVTDHPERLLMVYTADCVPVLLAADDGRRVAAVHAGWRGLVAGAIPAAVEVLGGSPTAAAIGPCLSLERCEMGPEVAEAFVDAGLGGVVSVGPRGRPHVDVGRAAALQLERAGYARIDRGGGCTWNDAQLFHSHRRDVTHGSRVRAGSLGALVATRR